MRIQSACFITFLAAVFISVPAVATLLMYEIEIVHQMPQRTVVNHDPDAFDIENATFSNFAPDPFHAIPKLGPSTTMDEPANIDLSENGIADIHRLSGLFANAPQESNRSGAEWETADNSGRFRPVQPEAGVFSFRLPFYVNGKSVVVKFDPAMELHNSAAMFFIGTGLIGIAKLKRKKYKKRVRRYRKIM